MSGFWVGSVFCCMWIFTWVFLIWNDCPLSGPTDGMDYWKSFVWFTLVESSKIFISCTFKLGIFVFYYIALIAKTCVLLHNTKYMSVVIKILFKPTRILVKQNLYFLFLEKTAGKRWEFLWCYLAFFLYRKLDCIFKKHIFLWLYNVTEPRGLVYHPRWRHLTLDPNTFHLTVFKGNKMLMNYSLFWSDDTCNKLQEKQFAVSVRHKCFIISCQIFNELIRVYKKTLLPDAEDCWITVKDPSLLHLSPNSFLPLDLLHYFFILSFGMHLSKLLPVSLFPPPPPPPYSHHILWY